MNGKTSRSVRTMGAEHRRYFNKGKEDCAMYSHKINDPSEENMQYRMEITIKFCDPLTRQANEVVRISYSRKNENLNSKNEFNH